MFIQQNPSTSRDALRQARERGLGESPEGFPGSNDRVASGKAIKTTTVGLCEGTSSICSGKTL